MPSKGENPAKSKMKAEWYADGLRFECTQCGNCCTGPPGYVWFNNRETEAMAKATGLSPVEFREKYAHRHAGKWTLNEVRNKQGHFDCVFLERDDKGRALCGVYSVRPQQCRTWPFWPENLRHETAWRRAANGCPGMNSGNFYPADQVRIIRDSNAQK